MDDEKLINFVQKNNLLYDKRDVNFKNKIKKKEIWNMIANELGISEEMYMRRWTNLKDRFSKCKKGEQCASGSGASECNSWHLYDQMQFLNAHVQPRKTRGTCSMASTSSTRAPSPSSPFSLVSTQFFETDYVEVSNDTDNQSISASEILTTTPSPAASRKRKKGDDELQSSIIGALGAWQNHFKERQQLSGTINSFGSMIAGMVNDLPKEKQARAMRNAIDAVLAEQE